MANANVNKVIYGNDTLIDLTGDTATPSSVLKGAQFHTRSGSQATGTLDPVLKDDVAPSESTDVPATRAYAVGDYMWLTTVDPLDPSISTLQFCRVTTAITAGSTITSNKVVGTTIGAELSADKPFTQSFYISAGDTYKTFSGLPITANSLITVYLENTDILLTAASAVYSSAGFYTLSLSFAKTDFIVRTYGYIEIRG